MEIEILNICIRDQFYQFQRSQNNLVILLLLLISLRSNHFIQQKQYTGPHTLKQPIQSLFFESQYQNPQREKYQNDQIWVNFLLFQDFFDFQQKNLQFLFINILLFLSTEYNEADSLK